jgi:hypothetical protein
MLRASYLNIQPDADAKLVASKRWHLSLLLVFTLQILTNKVSGTSKENQSIRN